jgi:hypothetical protein
VLAYPGWAGDRAHVGAGVFEAALELEREQQVGQLRLAVRRPAPVAPSLPVQVIEPDRAEPVGRGGDGDDALGDERQQQVGEGEGTEMVRAELELEAVGRTPLGHSHHARVVDQDVDRFAIGEQLAREVPHRGQVRKIQSPNACGRGEGSLDCVAAVQVAHRQHDRGAGVDEGRRGRQPESPTWRP